MMGTDLDPCAVPAVTENKEANGIPDEKFHMLIGNIIDDKKVQDQVGYEAYDIAAGKYPCRRSGAPYSCGGKSYKKKAAIILRPVF